MTFHKRNDSQMDEQQPLRRSWPLWMVMLVVMAGYVYSGPLVHNFFKGNVPQPIRLLYIPLTYLEALR